MQELLTLARYQLCKVVGTAFIWVNLHESSQQTEIYYSRFRDKITKTWEELRSIDFVYTGKVMGLGFSLKALWFLNAYHFSKGAIHEEVSIFPWRSLKASKQTNEHFFHFPPPNHGMIYTWETAQYYGFQWWAEFKLISNLIPLLICKMGITCAYLVGLLWGLDKECKYSVYMKCSEYS